MLSRRSQKSQVTWKAFQRILERFPLKRPKRYVPYSALRQYAISVNLSSKRPVREIRTPGSVGGALWKVGAIQSVKFRPAQGLAAASLQQLHWLLEQFIQLEAAKIRAGLQPDQPIAQGGQFP